MNYTTIIYSCEDAWNNPCFSFKINFLTHELSVEYKNNKGGVTLNGITLDEKQYNHLKQLSLPHIFEKFRDDKWKEKPEWMVLDGAIWEAKFLCDDGRPMLIMQSNLEPYPQPPILKSLIDYVLKIGTLGNMI